MNIPLKATVAICTYNRASLLSLCIESIAMLDFPKNEFEVLVIDNNSTDATEDIYRQCVSKFSTLNLRYVMETQQGIAHARTRGALDAKGEIIAYIDDDCLAEKNWLREIVSFYSDHPEAMSTGGRIIPVYTVPVATWYGKYFWGLVGNYDLGKKIFQMKGARYPSGANMHFRFTAFEKYGYFDSQLGRLGTSLMAGEEKAMYLKLLAGREKVYYLPQVIVYHHVEANKFDKNYVRRHSMGIGASERIMNKDSAWKLAVKFAEYIGKLGYAAGYGFFYLLHGQPSKMAMLVKFRWWVIKGFLRPSEAR